MNSNDNILFVISTKVRSTEWRNLPELKPILSFVGLLLIMLGQTSCKKSQEARKLEQELNDTKWEFYYAEDANGNDITAQVLSDSVICECFEFFKTDKDATTYNAYISRCHGTFFEDYNANWLVSDWKRIYKEYKRQDLDTSTIIATWTKFTVSVGNVGLESKGSYLYLRNIKFDMDKDIIVNKVLFRDETNFNTNEIIEYRYYKKVS